MMCSDLELSEADVVVEDHGSICLVRHRSAAGRAWLDANVSEEATWFGGALAVEPRYLFNLVEGMRADGLGVAC
jgi:hypothetical protein